MQPSMEPGSSVGAVRSTRVLLGQELRPALLLLQDGKIQQVQPHSAHVACQVTKHSRGPDRGADFSKHVVVVVAVVSLTSIAPPPLPWGVVDRCWMWATVW